MNKAQERLLEVDALTGEEAYRSLRSKHRALADMVARRGVTPAEAYQQIYGCEKSAAETSTGRLCKKPEFRLALEWRCASVSQKAVERINIRMPGKMFDEITRLARERNRSRSKQLVQIIAEWLEGKGMNADVAQASAASKQGRAMDPAMDWADILGDEA